MLNFFLDTFNPYAVIPRPPINFGRDISLDFFLSQFEFYHKLKTSWSFKNLKIKFEEVNETASFIQK